MSSAFDGVRPRIASLEASLIGEVSRLGFGQPDVLPLWFGEGDEPTPAFICEAAAAALRAGETFYTFNLGIPPLRQALAEYETGLHERSVTPDRVVVTSSGMQGIYLTVQSIVDPGENVLVVSPVWPNIRHAIEIFGGEARDVALGRTNDGGFRLDLAALEARLDGKTKAVFVNSPNNPTGWTASRAEAQALLDFTRRHGLWLIADEVYARVVYDGKVAPSFLDIIEPDDRVVVVNSFSKAWCMTGWRLGWIVVPASWQEMLAKIIQYNTSGSPTFIQHAGVTAVTEGESFIARMNAQFRAGRDLVMERLGHLPRVRLRTPDAAFYAFLQVDGLADSLDYAKRILAETRVGLAPGAAFGLGGEGHLRLCFAASRDRLEPALDRLAKFLV
ncbi:MAG TPA: pyridoxal phosphate-dependent aminotransferase [Aliidongia sp.]|nr:pyridoxal phosphate-dependent aminotransferase [Aliidongia sp.]